ncbi:MerR family transcriptional regulator [Christensenella intestinihominis]|uniref:MerR family transcriptional regulator n=1 Tax=Christensenella intestinihominis TaxID=1851429 RepID=UPI00082EAF29|nr:MerR family transcriptional regulator [Christensenella intestinihominis]
MVYPIGVFSSKVGLAASTLRYYEQQKLLSVKRDKAGRRIYDETDIPWLAFIIRLKETGMPIREIREYARLRSLGDSTMAGRLILLRQHKERVQAEQQKLSSHLENLDRKIEFYQASLAKK